MKKQFRRLMAGAAAVAAVASMVEWNSAPLAATVTANVAVGANVAANCEVNAGSVAFGTYDPLGAHDAGNLDVDGSFTLRCTRGTPAVISLGDGLHYSSGRRMHSGSDYLAYDLFTTAGRSTVWNASNTVAYNSTGKALVTQTIFGRVPGGQDAAVGSYTDTVVATVTF